MAIQWGSSIRGWRVGIDFTVTHTYASKTQTVRADFYFQGDSGYNINDSNNSFSASFAGGSLSGSRKVYLTSSGGTVHLGSITRTCYSAFGSTTAFPASMSISGLEAIGGTLSASRTYTVARRPYSAPESVSGLVGTRSSNSTINLGWTNRHSTSSGSEWYGAEIRVDGYRQNLDGTSTLAFGSTLGNTATSYTRTNLYADRAYTFSVSVRNTDAAAPIWSGWIYPTPAAPTGCTNTRNSDTRNTVSWKNTAPNYPLTNVLIERSTSGGAFTQIATVGGTATSYTDNGAAANNHYRYRVRTRYGNKYSGYSTSGYTYNTPAKPSNVRAAKNADNSVTVSWNDNARTESGHSLQRSQNGGATWATVTSSIAANTTSYRDSAAPGGSLIYRVEAHRHPLYSGWSASSPSITTIAPPKAPTITDYPQATVNAEDGSFTIGWLHNPVDGSAQTMAQVEITDPAGVTTWTDLAGGTKTYTIDDISAGTYKVKVFTKGAHANWSPASSQVTITVAIPPQVIITAPATDGEVIDALPYITSWTYDGAGYDPVRVDYYIQRQEEDGSWTTVYLDQTVAGNGSVTLDANTVIPRNGGTYRVHIWARAGSGLTTMTDRVFTTDYVEPAQPVVTVEHDPDKLSTSVFVEEFGSSIVGRNLVPDSKPEITTDSYSVLQGRLSEPWEAGATYTVTIKGSINTPNRFYMWNTSESGPLPVTYITDYDTERGVYTKTFVCPTQYEDPDPYTYRIYNYPAATATSATIEWIKIEHGSVATDWTPAPEDVIMPESYTVLRITDEGETVLATDLTSGGVVDDPIPPLNKTYTYRIISHAASGAISEQDIAGYINTPATFAINYGPGFTEILLARFNTTLDTDVAKEQKLQEYEGRVYPVLYEGRRRDLSISLSTQIDKTLVRDWDGLDSWAGVCILRTPDGLRLPVKERHSISTEYNNPVATIDIDMTRIDYDLG